MNCIFKIINKFNLLIVIFFLFRIALCFQGFDFCDEGFVLFSFKNIIHNPVDQIHYFPYYFSGLVGGFFEFIYPQGGIIYFRLLTVFFEFLILIILLNLLKCTIPKFIVLIAFILIVLFQQFGVIVLHHNLISGFLGILAVFLLIMGLDKPNRFLLFFSGIMFILFGFSRITNFIVVGLVFLSLVKTPIEINKNNKIFFKRLLPLIYGYIVGFFLLVMVVIYFNHHITLLKAFGLLWNSGNTSSSNHGFKRLIYVTLHSWYQIIYFGLFFGVLQYFFIQVLKYFENLNFRFFLFYVGVVLTIFLICYIPLGSDDPTIYGFVLFGIFNLYTQKSILKKTKLLSNLGIIFLFFNPIGSDYFFNFSPWSLYLIMPLSLYGYYLKLTPKIIEISFGKIAMFTLLLTLMLKYVWSIYNNCYFDAGSRCDKRFSINSEKAKLIYTTSERSRAINTLLNALPIMVPKSYSLIVYNSLPMLFYITDYKSATKNPWLWTLDAELLYNELKVCDKGRKKIAVVYQKMNTISQWDKPFAHFCDKKSDDWRNRRENREIFSGFLIQNRYILVWENDYFGILLN